MQQIASYTITFSQLEDELIGPLAIQGHKILIDTLLESALKDGWASKVLAENGLAVEIKVTAVADCPPFRSTP